MSEERLTGLVLLHIHININIHNNIENISNKFANYKNSWLDFIL